MKELGEPDYAFHRNEVDLIVARMWRSAEPWVLLLNAWQDLVRRGYSEHRVETAITRWTPNHEKEKLARDREFEAWVRPRIERHFAFRALNRHLAGLGIEPMRPIGFAEYSGQFGTYGYIVRKEHLPVLERRAQDEAGFTSDTDRAKGAEEFRIYLRRHYDEDWQENQRTLPPVDQSPYRIPGPD
ncbi:MAG TPA: hypothetical protein VIL42_05005 [Sphingomicrobium sp.]|jgi:hypothetical protein